MRAAVFDVDGTPVETGKRAKSLKKDGKGYQYEGAYDGTVVSYGPGFVRIKDDKGRVATRHPHRIRMVR